MPEYLSPGVYVEEIDTGAKPIEGVSTSTAGMLGVTERGPVDVPVLITSVGEFTRWFGAKLSIEEFSNGPHDAHCYLPHAVEGFFTNGGQRTYVTRVLDTEGAQRSAFTLHDRGSNTSAFTLLLRAAGEQTGTLANAPPLYAISTAALLPGTGPLNAGDEVRVGDGSRSEYRQIAAPVPAAAATHVALNFPVSRSHAAGLTVDDIARTAIAIAGITGLTIDQDAPAGATAITITGTGANVANGLVLLNAMLPGPFLEIGAQVQAEHRFIAALTPIDATRVRLTLDSPLVRAYKASTVIVPLSVTAPSGSTLSLDMSAGDRVLFVAAMGGNFTTPNHLVVIDKGAAATREVRRLGELVFFEISAGAYGEYATSSVMDVVTLGDDDRTVTAFTTPTSITLDDASVLSPGDTLHVGKLGNLEVVTVATANASTGVVTLSGAGLALAHVAPEPAVPGFSLKELTANARVGSTVLALDNRRSLSVGDVLRIDDVPNDEYATIAAIPNPAPAGPNPGVVILDHRLNLAHAGRTIAAPGARVRCQHPPALNSARPASSPALEVAAGSALIVSTDGSGYALGDFVRIATSSGETAYHRIDTTPVVLAPVPIDLNLPLDLSHDTGSELVQRSRQIVVQALDSGAWGNRLRISVEDESPGLVSLTRLRNIIFANQIRLASAAGVEAGSVLELLDPLNGDAVVGDPIKVAFVDRAANFAIHLDTPLSAPQIAAEAAAAGAGSHLGVRSREFSITVTLLHQADPARPARSEIVIDSEVFRNLSMDHRHSRYFQTIIGATDGPLRISDRRPEGESWYIRVHDVAFDLPDPARTMMLERVRLGPEPLIDILPNGSERPARHPLSGGDDSVATLTDATYIGTDNVNPEDRTGLFSFVSVDDISIIACPGRTGPAIQGALISQSELLRYRFAVLDGPRPPGDGLPDVQNQRQQFDTKYAALYYPWLVIPDPFPKNLAKIADYPVPPAGHVTGIYARTDIERGVHKAPANEVVRGILGLRRIINKGEQDILNAFPVNINVIRDFRSDERSIRVWGGRVITSDTDWKYVNVRRLVIFIEKSLDRGLQWVVFEPNAEPLWARVRRTISDFLRVVWRNGALEGVKPEEAYFVKCDRTTMTQADIDNGRLIVVVGVAPVKPAEFVIVRIGLLTRNGTE